MLLKQTNLIFINNLNFNNGSEQPIIIKKRGNL